MADEHLDLQDVFTRPPSPPPPAPTFALYRRPSHLLRPAPDPDPDTPPWEELSIRLVGAHPLWGDHLWNAARSCAAYLDAHAPALVAGRAVLELGAGGGLPGLVAALCGAREVLLTDYPDPPLLDNLRHNADATLPPAARARVRVQGHIWGRAAPAPPRAAFDLVLMSDLIFNHSQHDALLSTAAAALAPAPGAALLVFYTHHRPALAARDVTFFARARARGWACAELLTQRLEPMFPDDAGDEDVRATVHGWRLTRRGAA